MKTAIIYATTHGTTEKAARMIKDELGEDTISLFNLKKDGEPDLREFERVIVGGSIHAGRIQSSIKKFCTRKSAELLQKELGLFLCGMNKPAYRKQFENAFSEELRSHSRSNKTLGGEFLFEKMNFFQRFIVKRIAKIKESVSDLKEDRVKKFTRKFDSSDSSGSKDSKD